VSEYIPIHHITHLNQSGSSFWLRYPLTHTRVSGNSSVDDASAS
jgi:hypothetical protein